MCISEHLTNISKYLCRLLYLVDKHCHSIAIFAWRRRWRWRWLKTRSITTEKDGIYLQLDDGPVTNILGHLYGSVSFVLLLVRHTHTQSSALSIYIYNYIYPLPVSTGCDTMLTCLSYLSSDHMLLQVVAVENWGTPAFQVLTERYCNQIFLCSPVSI